jgi:endonuclease/exonuclease/phosphatase family metal-dependent hydrolase
MRSVVFSSLSVLLLVTSCASGPQQLERPDLTLASFNIHYLSLRDDVLPWDERSAAVKAVLEGVGADLLAFQEMETFGGGHQSSPNIQLDYLLRELPRYKAAAVGDPELYPSTQPILYDPSVLQPVEQGYFFFSPTPDEIYSRPWHGRFPAFCSWVRFEELQHGHRFVVYNVHFDASSPRDRLKSAELTMERIDATAAGDPVVVAGDFNAPLLFPTMRRFLRNGYRHSGIRGSTFHFNRGLHLIPAIDHILVRGQIRSAPGRIMRDRPGGRFPSDHYPVLTQLGFVHSD